MKKIFTIILVLSVGFTFAQEKQKVETKKDGDLTIATYYHDNGVVQQEGTFNKEGKLHGVWTSYDLQGNKLAVGNYENGRKTGKWFFWSGKTLKEVDYKNQKIANVIEWNSASDVAINN